MLPRGQVCVHTALMRMRWVIKRNTDSGLKARLVVLGFTDPQLGVKNPPHHRRCHDVGRQLFSTVVGSQGISVFKADAKTAFLQGSVGNEGRSVIQAYNFENQCTN